VANVGAGRGEKDRGQYREADSCSDFARQSASSAERQQKSRVLRFDLLLGRQGGRVAMHQWHLLEACVVFAMALTFVIAFRLNK
jgi:hypothetical protein